MKYIIILTLLLSGCCCKEVATLKQNQKTMVDAINAIGSKVMESDKKTEKK